MEKNFPCPIVSEKDLNYYESYLKKCGEAKVKAAPPAVSSFGIAEEKYYATGFVGALDAGTYGVDGWKSVRRIISGR